MRQGNKHQRSRGRSNRRGSNNNPNRSYDSNGPSGKLRGTAAQLVDKYQALAHDARANRDRVVVESMLQHAEHYQRLVNEANAAKAAAQAQAREQQEAANAANGSGVAATNEEQTQVDVPADGDQPEVSADAGEQNGAPVRRQRRSNSRRRTAPTNGASKDEAASADDAASPAELAAKVEAAEAESSDQAS